MREQRSRRASSLLAIGCVTAAAACAFPAASASAASGGEHAGALQKRISRELRANPGGEQISANQIAWRQRGVVLTFSPPGAARAARAARAWCGLRSVCLYQDANQRGWGVAYRCVWRRGSYYTWNLRGTFPVDRREGVSSFIRNGVPQATLLGYDQSHSLGSARGNVASWFNDEAVELTVRC